MRYSDILNESKIKAVRHTERNDLRRWKMNISGKISCQIRLKNRVKIISLFCLQLRKNGIGNISDMFCPWNMKDRNQAKEEDIHIQSIISGKYEIRKYCKRTFKMSGNTGDWFWPVSIVLLQNRSDWEFGHIWFPWRNYHFYLCLSSIVTRRKTRKQVIKF